MGDKQDKMMKTYREEFEKLYGEGSFNDDFLISANQAENIHNRAVNANEDIQTGAIIKIFGMAINLPLKEFKKWMEERYTFFIN